MGRINRVENAVRRVLEGNEQTRNNNNLLYIKVCEELGCNTNYSIKAFFDAEFAPPYESVTRARRKLQENHKHLRPIAKVKQWRIDREEEFREYAKAKME